MVRLLFAGDFVSKDSEKLTLSESLKNMLEKADICSCNFEVPIQTKAKALPKSGSSLWQSPGAPAFLEKNGFNLIQLANNHMYDYGKLGLYETRKAFKKAALVGAGNFNEAYSPQILKVDGKTMGFLALTHKEFGCIENETDESGVAWISHPIVDNLIRDTKQKVDFLFILVHAGIEHIDVPLPEWRNRYKAFIDLGADAVVASHPHVPQGWEEYNNRPIFYSLGNFCFDTNRIVDPLWYKSLLVEFIISDKVDYLVHNVKYDNCLIDIDSSTDTRSHVNYLNRLLKDSDEYYTYLNSILLNLGKKYYINNLVPHNLNFLRRILVIIYYKIRGKESYNMLINLFQCESHRWAILRILYLMRK